MRTLESESPKARPAPETFQQQGRNIDPVLIGAQELLRLHKIPIPKTGAEDLAVVAANLLSKATITDHELNANYPHYLEPCNQKDPRGSLKFPKCHPDKPPVPCEIRAKRDPSERQCIRIDRKDYPLPEGVTYHLEPCNPEDLRSAFQMPECDPEAPPEVCNPRYHRSLTERQCLRTPFEYVYELCNMQPVEKEKVAPAAGPRSKDPPVLTCDPDELPEPCDPNEKPSPGEKRKCVPARSLCDPVRNRLGIPVCTKEELQGELQKTNAVRVSDLCCLILEQKQNKVMKSTPYDTAVLPEVDQDSGLFLQVAGGSGGKAFDPKDLKCKPVDPPGTTRVNILEPCKPGPKCDPTVPLVFCEKPVAVPKAGEKMCVSALVKYVFEDGKKESCDPDAKEKSSQKRNCVPVLYQAGQQQAQVGVKT